MNINIEILKLKMVREDTLTYGFEKPMSSPQTVYELLTGELIDLANSPEEKFYLICMDVKNKPVGIHMVSQGTKTSSIVSPAEVFKRALLNNATSVIVAHNHPSGNPNPSQADIDITKQLQEAGKILDIKLLDHIIIGNESKYSLRENGYM